MSKNFHSEPDFQIKSKDFYDKKKELEKKYPDKRIDFLKFGIIPPDFNVFIFDDRITFVEVEK